MKAPKPINTYVIIDYLEEAARLSVDLRVWDRHALYTLMENVNAGTLTNEQLEKAIALLDNLKEITGQLRPLMANIRALEESLDDC